VPLEPVNLGIGYRTIGKTNGCYPLELTPVGLSVLSVQAIQNSNSVTGCDRLDLADVTQNFELDGSLAASLSVAQRPAVHRREPRAMTWALGAQ
jgi:hypothetical protein